MIQLDFGFGSLEAELWRLVFVMCRIGAAMLAAPFFGAAAIPAQLRVGMAGAFAVMVCATTPITAPDNLLSAQGLLALAGEIFIGLALGFVLQISFAAPVIAAEIMGGGMGMSMASTADPTHGARSPAFGQYFTVVLTLIFLALGAHLHWLRLIMESYQTFPPGQTWLGADRLAIMAGFASTMFLTALAIALPVTLVLLLMQMLTGVLSRSAPSLNLFALGLPAGVLAGLGALIAAVPVLGDQLTILSTTAIEQTAAIITR